MFTNQFIITEKEQGENSYRNRKKYLWYTKYVPCVFCSQMDIPARQTDNCFRPPDIKNTKKWEIRVPSNLSFRQQR